MRITGDSVEGKAELDNFIDPESKFPVIATTSELLTTGVDAKTCKLIVLDKTINSMTVFKQIIGRGTRIEEEYNKYFFTIMDFKKATELFRDPDFDGEPVVIYEPGDDDDPVPPDPKEPGDDGGESVDNGGKIKYVINDMPVDIVAERVEYYGPDGNLITESYRDFTRKQIRAEFASLDEFLTRWNSAEKKQAIIELLEEHGIILDNLAEQVGKEYGDFDLICHIAYDQPPLSRKERADNVKRRNYFTKYGEQARAILNALLDKYAHEDIGSIENPKVLNLKPFRDLGTPLEIINDAFGGKANYEKAIQELEQVLFSQEKWA
jgi:type I restriction enzyme R subunit